MTTSICQTSNKLCNKHGVVERTKAGRCKICESERFKIYYDNNFEKNRARSRRSYSGGYPDSYYKNRKIYYKNNIYGDKNVKIHIINLDVCRRGKILYTDLPIEIVEIKRLQMKLLHAIKQREKLEKVL